MSDVYGNYQLVFYFKKSEKKIKKYVGKFLNSRIQFTFTIFPTVSHISSCTSEPNIPVLDCKCFKALTMSSGL